ncbi:unnamed protein product, partial [Discosporangium mesarthrocarpum]
QLSPSLRGVDLITQAVDQLVQCLTDDRFKGNLVCVVAGYDADIDDLMTANPGLASRFPETIHFPDFDVEDCCQLLKDGVEGMGLELDPDINDD